MEMELEPPSTNVMNLQKNEFNAPKMDEYPYGNRYIAVRNPNSTNKKRNELRTRFRKVTPIYTEATFPNAPDDTYVYIVSDKGFFANKVRSYMELGTYHKILASESKSTKIFVAGEVRKRHTSVMYNLLSGTYTLTILRAQPPTSRTALEQSMRERMDALFRSYGLEPTFTTTTFVSPVLLPFSENELQLYKNIGYEVRSFSKEGYCSPTEVTRLKHGLQTQQRMYKRIQTLGGDTSSIEAEIAHLEKKLLQAETCIRDSIRMGGERKKKKTKKAKKSNNARTKKTKVKANARS